MACVQVYKVGKKGGDHGARTEFDPTDKPITPMGGFVGYGEVNEDYVIIKVRAAAAFLFARLDFFFFLVFRCGVVQAGAVQLRGGWRAR